MSAAFAFTAFSVDILIKDDAGSKEAAGAGLLLLSIMNVRLTNIYLKVLRRSAPMLTSCHPGHMDILLRLNKPKPISPLC